MISDTAFWGAIGAGVPLMMGIVGWSFSLERRLGSRLTRREHTKICEDQRNQTEAKLDSIADAIENVSKRIETAEILARDERTEVRSDINRLVTRVALVQQHLGMKVNEDI